jgi:segregation and condensation protein A
MPDQPTAEQDSVQPLPVTAYAVRLEQFEGPLALLLEMIEGEKLDISKVSLAAVTESYLKFLDANPGIPPEELADFLVVASRLLLIKSRLLLPFIQVPEEDEGDLESQLKIYKEYLDASKLIEKMIGKRRFLFVHEKLPSVEIGFAPPKKLTVGQMRDLFLAAIKRLDAVVKVPQAIIEKTVSIHEKITQIRALVNKAERVSFRRLIQSAESRTEIVVSFLALLELIKQRSIRVSQDRIFDDITISLPGDETDASEGKSPLSAGSAAVSGDDQPLDSGSADA